MQVPVPEKRNFLLASERVQFGSVYWPQPQARKGEKVRPLFELNENREFGARGRPEDPRAFPG